METPQNAFWKNEYKMQNGWTLAGHSRARERTCFVVKELKLFLDAGIGCETVQGQFILLTHSHFDHAGALPQLLRGPVRNKVFLPSEVTNRIREYCNASWAMKVNDSKPTPPNYLFTPKEITAGEEFTDNVCTWVPMSEGVVLPLNGKGDKNGDLFIHAVKCYHTVSTVGYLISEKRLKLKEEYRGVPGAQLAQLRRDGVNINEVTEIFKLAYLCDSTHEVFEHEGQREKIFQCSVIIAECSFLQSEMDGEAVKRGHSSWGYLRPIVESHPEITFILCHFSHRYREEEIISFFETASSSGTKLANVVVWADSLIASLPQPSKQLPPAKNNNNNNNKEANVKKQNNKNNNNNNNNNNKGKKNAKSENNSNNKVEENKIEATNNNNNNKSEESKPEGKNE